MVQDFEYQSLCSRFSPKQSRPMPVSSAKYYMHHLCWQLLILCKRSNYDRCYNWKPQNRLWLRNWNRCFCIFRNSHSMRYNKIYCGVNTTAFNQQYLKCSTDERMSLQGNTTNFDAAREWWLWTTHKDLWNYSSVVGMLHILLEIPMLTLRLLSIKLLISSIILNRFMQKLSNAFVVIYKELTTKVCCYIHHLPLFWIAT